MHSLALKPLGRIIAYADAETEPIDFCVAPHHASLKALERAGLTISDIDYFEFNVVRRELIANRDAYLDAVTEAIEAWHTLLRAAGEEQVP